MLQEANVSNDQMKAAPSDDEIRDALVRSWPSPIVPRTQVEKFSGGMLRRGTLANLDCLGKGPARIVIAGRVGYLRDSLIELMLSRRCHGKEKAA